MPFAVDTDSQMTLRAYRIALSMPTGQLLIDAIQGHGSWLAGYSGVALTGTFAEAVHSRVDGGNQPITVPMMIFTGRVEDSAAADSAVIEALNDLAEHLAGVLTRPSAHIWYSDQAWTLRES